MTAAPGSGARVGGVVSGWTASVRYQGRVVVIAARSRGGAHAGAASLRHVTVTLASARAHLSRGAHAILAAALDATGRRLLVARRRFGANASVSGTVIGVIEAQLARQLVTLSASAHSASNHAAHRR